MKGAPPLPPLEEGLGFGGAHLGRRPPPPLPLYIVGTWGGRETQQPKAPPPPLSLSHFLLSLVATTSVLRDSHVRSCTTRWSCTIRTPSCCRCVGPKEIFFRKPRLDRGRRTSSLPNVYEYSGTPYFRPSGVVRGASRP